jgi:transposase
VADSSPDADRPSYEELAALIVELRAENAALRERIEELERKAGRDSTNSSMPPSSDRPVSRAERRRKAREAYKRSMGKSGGQPGHEGKSRELVGLERVDKRFEHAPDAAIAGISLMAVEQRVGDPVCHQQYELPVVVALVFEHARLRPRLHTPRRPG